MKTKLAAFYMETLWLRMGKLRNVRLFHKLFGLAYGVMIREYLATEGQ